MAKFSGRYRLENNCVAEVEPCEDWHLSGCNRGLASDRTKCRWDGNGRALDPKDHNYDLMERIREGAGQ